MSSVASNDVRPRLWRSRWAAIGAAVAVTFGGGGLFAVSAASPESSTVAIEPVRILDTRDPINVGLAGPFVSPVAQDLKVTGSVPTTTGTKIVVPAGATGVYLNVTPVGSTAAGFISVRPANASGLPSTSNVNFTAGAVNPNGVLVELPVGGADDGKIEITFDAFGVAGPTSDILVDVVGYTSDARLIALEANLATKANSADVAALPSSHIIAAGVVNGTGLKSTVAAQLGTYSVSRVGVGDYRLTVPMVCAPNKFPIIMLSLGFDASEGEIALGFGSCSSGQATFVVTTSNSAGANLDETWSFTAFSNTTALAGAAPLVDDTGASGCVTTDGSLCE